MAKELIPYLTGKVLSTIKTRWSNLAGQSLIASGGTFEAYNNANLASYEVSADSEQGTTGQYEVTIPVPSTLPITMNYVTRDTGSGLIVAVGSTELDAAGNKVASASQASVDAIPTNAELAAALAPLATQASVDAMAATLAGGVVLADMFGLPFDVITERMYVAACGDRDVNPGGDVEQYIGPDGNTVVFQSTIDQLTGSRVVVFS